MYLPSTSYKKLIISFIFIISLFGLICLSISMIIGNQNYITFTVGGEVNQDLINYTTDEDLLVSDAIELANGFTQYAYGDYLDLDEPIEDNQVIYVSLSYECKINPNYANMDDGEIYIYHNLLSEDEAAQIVSYSHEYYFETGEDLLNVPGLSYSSLLNIKDYLIFD